MKPAGVQLHRSLCHVNIGARSPVPSLASCAAKRTWRRAHLTPASKSGRSTPTSPKESPTSSVSDAVISFFDDITRGSVSSIDEEDLITPAAAAAAADATVAATTAEAAGAADSAAAAAEAAEGAAAELKGLTEALGSFEEVAVAAAVAAAATGAGSSSSSSSTAAAAGEKSKDAKAAAVKSLETLVAVAAQDLSVAGSRNSNAVRSSSSDVGSNAARSSSSNSSSSSGDSTAASHQAVNDEAVAAAGGELQAAALSLTAVGGEEAAAEAGGVAGWVVRGVVGVGVLLALKTGVEAAMQQLGMVSIPPAVVSMLSVPLLLSALNPSTADKALEWFDSSIAPWTTDLLGLFYVPAVAVLPVLLRGMQGADLVGLLGVAAAGTALTLLLSAAAALAPKPQPSHSTPESQSTPATPNHKTPSRSSPSASSSSAAEGYRVTSGPAVPLLLSLSFLAAAGPLALTRFDPLRFGAKMVLPVGFAWSLLGYLAARVSLQQAGGNGGNDGNGGNGGDSWLQLSPVLAGAVAANVGVAWHSRIMGWQLWEGLSRYYTGEVLGAGDLLCAPLGVALTALGFMIYKHRAALQPAAIAAAALTAAMTSLGTAVAAARLLGVSADWARALIPKSVTSSTASHFATALGAPPECAGLAVLLQAAFTIALGKTLLKAVLKPRLGPAAAGAAVGATAGVMGVVGVCGVRGVALANGAVAWACMTVMGSVMSGVPAVTAALAALVG